MDLPVQLSELSCNSTADGNLTPGTVNALGRVRLPSIEAARKASSFAPRTSYTIQGVERATRRSPGRGLLWASPHADADKTEGVEGGGGLEKYTSWLASGAGGSVVEEQQEQVLLVAADTFDQEPPASQDEAAPARAHKSCSCLPFRQSRRVAEGPPAKAAGSFDSFEQEKRQAKECSTKLDRISKQLEKQGDLKVVCLDGDVALADPPGEEGRARHAVVMISGKLPSTPKSCGILERLRKAGVRIVPVLVDGAEGAHTWRGPFHNSELLAARDLRGQGFRRSTQKLREDLLAASPCRSPLASFAASPVRSPGGVGESEVEALVVEAFRLADALGTGRVDLEVLLSHLHQRGIPVEADDVANMVRSPDARGDGELEYAQFCRYAQRRVGQNMFCE